jgi:hypothetical protein
VDAGRALVLIQVGSAIMKKKKALTKGLYKKKIT